MNMKNKILWFLVAALAAVLMVSCGDGDKLPKEDSINDYEYIFTVTAEKGELHIIYTFETDAKKILWSEEHRTIANKERTFTNIKEGETKTYTFSLKEAKRVSVKGEIVAPNSMGVKGSYQFEERLNGEKVRDKKEAIKLEDNRETQSFEFTSSSL